jgi:hypothetical protein
MRRARHRLGQFFHYLQDSPLAPAERAEVRAVLAPPLAALFERMTRGEQAHSLRVLRVVRAQAGGRALPSGLLQAALLHDVGKTRRPLGLVARVGVVVAGKLLPAQSRRWGEGEPNGWRGAFVTAARHAEWGAELCALAGADPLAVRLIRRHQDAPLADAAGDDEWLRLLQRADNDD